MKKFAIALTLSLLSLNAQASVIWNCTTSQGKNVYIEAFDDGHLIDLKIDGTHPDAEIYQNRTRGSGMIYILKGLVQGQDVFLAIGNRTGGPLHYSQVGPHGSKEPMTCSQASKGGEVDNNGLRF